MRTFYEFFAGGGMARAGLGSEWQCLFANDFDEMKAQTYERNWGASDLIVADIQTLSVDQIPGQADLAWASFPCQDLSLAGNYEGIGASTSEVRTRSGTFWSFWNIMRDLIGEKRGPRVIVLENVYGILTANSGADFAAIGRCFADVNYRFGAILVDAAHFLPQSRPRVFIVGIRDDIILHDNLTTAELHDSLHPKALRMAYRRLSDSSKKKWIWWHLAWPTAPVLKLDELITDYPEGVRWHTELETERLIAMMSQLNLKKLEFMRQSGRRWVGTIYKRTRLGLQRAELRCDGIAGCLRTPAGGSSRQLVIVVKDGRVRTRLLSAREAASLMGLPNHYHLPTRYNDAYHVAGDGVAVPVVRHISAKIIEPLLLVNNSLDGLKHAAE